MGQKLEQARRYFDEGNGYNMPQSNSSSARDRHTNNAEWLKTGISVAAFVVTVLIQTIGLTWFFGTTLTEFRGDVKLVQKDVATINSSMTEFKTDMKAAVVDLKQELKETNANQAAANVNANQTAQRNSTKIDILERRIEENEISHKK